MRLISLWLLATFCVAEAETPANWNANRPSGDRHSELRKQGHMDLGVRVATENPRPGLARRRHPQLFDSAFQWGARAFPTRLGGRKIAVTRPGRVPELDCVQSGTAAQ
jgi:hypothetical protein